MSDLFGFDSNNDPFGRTKKQRKRDQLEANKSQGKFGEMLVTLNYSLSGHEVERTGKGHDYRIRKRDMLTGKVVKSELHEVKTGKAKLSKLQQKTKKSKSNYKVDRYEPLI